MCILVIAKNLNPRFPLVVVHIREELLTRATAEVALDPQTKAYFARDMQAGGTWMGYNTKEGKLAVLTNSYDAATAELAWGRTLEFLDRHLSTNSNQ